MTKNLVANTFKQANFEVSKIETANRVEELQISTPQDKIYRIFIQEINLDNQRSVKIQKTDLGKLNRSR